MLLSTSNNCKRCKPYRKCPSQGNFIQLHRALCPPVPKSYSWVRLKSGAHSLQIGNKCVLHGYVGASRRREQNFADGWKGTWNNPTQLLVKDPVHWELFIKICWTSQIWMHTFLSSISSQILRLQKEPIILCLPHFRRRIIFGGQYTSDRS